MNTTQNATHMYNNLAPMIGGGGGTLPSGDFCNYQINEAVLQQVAKSMNFQQYSNPPLKDESGLTFNNTALPLPRKRPRDSSMASAEVLNNISTVNSPMISAPLGKVPGRYGIVSSGCNLSFLGEDLSLEMTQQQLEVDRLISLHMEKIRREMEERRREQSRRIIQSIQGAIGRKLREKEEQIDKIGKVNWALEERVRSLYLENQIWRDLAQTNEATANALRSNLEQVLSQVNAQDFQICSGGATADAATDDAESCCGSSGHGCEDEGDEVDGSQVLKWRKVAGTSSAAGERKEATAVTEEEKRKRMCRKCGGRESSVLLLPCRHLCLCTACGSAVDTCPVCNSTSDATVHVNLS
ncbi:hypothetical protein V2J09_001276 [Rumex salicifolius]